LVFLVFILRGATRFVQGLNTCFATCPSFLILPPPCQLLWLFSFCSQLKKTGPCFPSRKATTVCFVCLSTDTLPFYPPTKSLLFPSVFPRQIQNPAFFFFFSITQRNDDFPPTRFSKTSELCTSLCFSPLKSAFPNFRNYFLLGTLCHFDSLFSMAIEVMRVFSFCSEPFTTPVSSSSLPSPLNTHLLDLLPKTEIPVRFGSML